MPAAAFMGLERETYTLETRDDFSGRLRAYLQFQRLTARVCQGLFSQRKEEETLGENSLSKVPL